MGTVLVYDWDYFHYQNVIPNLECAKYAAWRKSRKDIVVSTPILEPTMYTKTFFRKEYDDGIYDKKILLPGVDYGGRAFSSVYQPMEMAAERIEPDWTIYDNHRHLYGPTDTNQKELKTILFATHVRLSLDGKKLEPFPFDRLRPRHPSVIFHDYDAAAVPGALELLKEVSQSRPSGLPYRIGNKFPVNVYDFSTLYEWLSLPPMGSCFYLQYNGLFTTDELAILTEKPILGLRQLLYNFTYNCADEEDFLVRVLPIFYKQTLFLRSYKIKILLNIDTNFFKTKELLNLMKTIDCFYGKNHLEFIRPHKQTLYNYCAWRDRAYIETFPWQRFSVSQQEMREAFQYIRKKNYEVFDMFYSTPNVIIKGGELVNEWTANR